MTSDASNSALVADNVVPVQTMRAAAIQSLDGPDGVALVRRPLPIAGPGMVVIDVHAAGVAFPDLLISHGRYQQRPELPWVPGGEVAGTVRTAPSGSGFAPGDRVWAYLVDQGGYAEVVAAPSDTVFPLADGLDFAEGAALGINFLTAVFALGRRGRLRSGETILILGAAGGLGTACVSVAAAYGARVIASVSSEAKGNTARRAGASEVVVGEDWRDAVLELTGGRGVEVVADIVGGDQTLQALRTTVPEGRLLILGFASGAIASLTMNRPLLRNVSVVGVGLGMLAEFEPTLFADMAQELDRLIAAGLRPIVGSAFALERADDALRQLDERRAAGKVVLTVRG